MPWPVEDRVDRKIQAGDPGGRLANSWEVAEPSAPLMAAGRGYAFLHWVQMWPPQEGEAEAFQHHPRGTP